MTEPGAVGPLGSLGIDLPKFLAQLFNFFIVVLVLWRLYWKPLQQKIDERVAIARKTLADAATAAKSREDAEMEKQRLLSDAELVARSRIDAAEAEGQSVRNQKVELAKAEVAQLHADAEVKLAADREQALHSTRRELTNLVAEGMRRTLQNFSPETHRMQIDAAIESL